MAKLKFGGSFCQIFIPAKTFSYAVIGISLLWMGAIAFADLDFLSDAELHVVKWSLKDIKGNG